MLDLQEKIREIDLPALVESYGVDLRSQGGAQWGLCPLHDEKTPSFRVYRDDGGKWRFHCFGCRAGGDAIDLIMRLHGIDFKAACNHLGICHHPVTRAEKKQIAEKLEKQARQRALKQFIRQWERDAIFTYSIYMRATHKAMTQLTVDNLVEYGDILSPLETWSYFLDILQFGDDRQKFELFKMHLKNKTILMRRQNLFKDGFDFSAYLEKLR